MILCIDDVLTADEVGAARRHFDAGTFVDGTATAGWQARLVKKNEQLAYDDPQVEGLRGLATTALRRNRLFQMAVRPKSVAALRFSRYRQGMAYGSHVDDAIIQGQRTDVSFTLFLSDPDSYDGGELVMEQSGGDAAYKLDPGQMIVYPSTTLHHVASVTRGERLCIVGWVRSLVRDPAQREILFDLDTVRHQLFRASGKTREVDLLAKTVSNLLRCWADD